MLQLLTYIICTNHITCYIIIIYKMIIPKYITKCALTYKETRIASYPAQWILDSFISQKGYIMFYFNHAFLKRLLKAT